MVFGTVGAVAWRTSDSGQVPACQSFKLLFNIEQKAFDSDTKVITGKFIHCFISVRVGTTLQCILIFAIHPCTLQENFKEPLWTPHHHRRHFRLHNKLPHKSLPAFNATLHWIASQTELGRMIKVELFLNFLSSLPWSKWLKAVS